MTPSDQISGYIANLKDWRGELLIRIREIIREEVPSAEEEWKWSSPVYSNHGLLLATGAFKAHVNVNFFKGAHLPDPHNLFTRTDAKGMRSIKLTGADTLNEPAFREIIRAAVAYNAASLS